MARLQGTERLRESLAAQRAHRPVDERHRAGAEGSVSVRGDRATEPAQSHVQAAELCDRAYWAGLLDDIGIGSRGRMMPRSAQIPARSVWAR
jgi:hypothetical protein